MTDDRPRVVALVPGYEEGPRIAAVVEATRRHLPVIVVDDGSTDDTAANAEAAGAEVIRQVPNQGKGAALRAGFARALDDGLRRGRHARRGRPARSRRDPALRRGLRGPRRDRPAARAAHRQPRLLADAAGAAPVQHARDGGLLVGRRPARARQPVGLPAARPAPDDGDAGQPGVRLRVRGRDDRRLHPQRLDDRAGCRSRRSTPASPATSGRWRICATSCARRAPPAGSSGSRAEPRPWAVYQLPTSSVDRRCSGRGASSRWSSTSRRGAVARAMTESPAP